MPQSLEALYREICHAICKDPDATTNGFCPAHQDKNGSLSVTLNDDRTKILIKCFAGCDVREIVRNLGYEMSDLFRDADRPGGVVGTPPLQSGRRKKNHNKKKYIQSNITVERLAEIKRLPVDYLTGLGVRNGRWYGSPCVNIEYRDERGKELKLGRRRMAEKATTGMLWEKGSKPTLYGLWFLGRISKLGWCVLVEGESDCWTLWLHKHPALGIPGADMIDKIQIHHVENLKKIFVFLEPDKGGETFEKKIPERLAEIGWSGDLYAIRLDGYKDPSDLHVRGGDAEFERLWTAAIKDAENHRLKLMPSQQDQKSDPPPQQEKKSKNKWKKPEYGEALTDLGNAERMAKKYGDRIRWCEEWKRWLIWDQMRWAVDRECRITRLATQTARSIYDEIKNANGKKNDVFGHAKRSEGRERVRAMVELSKSQDGISILSERLDNHPMLITVNNGVVDLSTGKLTPARSDYYLTRLTPVDYDSGAKCPTWEKFLDRIMDGDQDMVKFLQRAVGYSLTGLCSDRCFFLLWGGGKNGKSTFLETLQALLGDYALRTPTATLMVQRNAPAGATASPDLARLKGARFVSASESESGQMLSEAKIKDMTGQDTISARHLYGDLFDFRPEFKLWMCTNHKPIIRGSDDAIWDRVKLVPFTVRIPPEEQDPHLGKRLRGELPGILQWAVDGCIAWQQGGLAFPEKIEQAVSEYRDEMDLLGEWLEEQCCIDPTADCSNTELYKNYRKYCEDRAQKMLHHKNFSQELRSRGMEQYRTKRERRWRGIRPLTEDEIDSDFYNFGQDENCSGDRMTRGDTCSRESKAISSHDRTLCEPPSSPVIPSPEPSEKSDKAIDLNQFRGK